MSVSVVLSVKLSCLFCNHRLQMSLTIATINISCRLAAPKIVEGLGKFEVEVEWFGKVKRFSLIELIFLEKCVRFFDLSIGKVLGFENYGMGREIFWGLFCMCLSMGVERRVLDRRPLSLRLLEGHVVWVNLKSSSKHAPCPVKSLRDWPT